MTEKQHMKQDTEQDSEQDSEQPSKSQRKRDMQELRALGEKLVQLNDEQLAPLMQPKILMAIQECRKITKGNPRKRQLQYIAKLLNGIDVNDVRTLVDRYDASSKSHLRQFHQLEKWREQLISGNYAALNDIAAHYPDLDRQFLKQLTRKAILEGEILENEQNPHAPIQFRKIFQYLKSLADSNASSGNGPAS
jgi:ribosome-associated protein